MPLSSTPQARCLVALLALLLLGQPTLAQDRPSAVANLVPDDLDSEHLFGFAEGSDLGVPGQPELEWETTGRIGRRTGRFLAVDSGLALKLPVTSDFRLAPGLSFNAYDIGAAGQPARTTGGVSGGFLETRVRLLDRRAAPFGLTLSVVPAYAGVDTGSGLPAAGFGTEAALLADRELIPGRLVAALNFGFGFATTRLAGDEQVLASGLELAAALAYQVSPGLFLGGEARYARAYDRLGLDRLTGEAAYLGPTLYATVSARAWTSFTWSVQVAGQAAGEPGPLDLTGFDRHQMRLRVGYNF